MLLCWLLVLLSYIKLCLEKNSKWWVSDSLLPPADVKHAVTSNTGARLSTTPATITCNGVFSTCIYVTIHNKHDMRNPQRAALLRWSLCCHVKHSWLGNRKSNVCFRIQELPRVPCVRLVAVVRLKADLSRAVWRFFIRYTSKMSPLCDCCREHIDKLSQQVSVMRKEIKNLRYVHNIASTCFFGDVTVLIVFLWTFTCVCLPLCNRQVLDSAVRAHRKHMISIQSAVAKMGPDRDQTAPPPTPASSQAALERGNYH